MGRPKSILAVLAALAALMVIWLKVAADETGKNPHGDLRWDCQYCHTPESWSKLKQPLEFDHGQTGFVLTGAHSGTDCRNCHKDLIFSRIGTGCVDCHTDIHRNQFGIECSNCHVPQDWNNRQDILEQHARRGFPLLGRHAIADCDACHIRQGREEYAGTPVDCDGCHYDNFVGSENPSHIKAGFAKNCDDCHPPVAAGWFNTTYEHPAAFALKGSHKRVDCVGCHPQNYAGTQILCIGCHEADFQATTNPAHVALGFPTNCEVCHDESRWPGVVFDHVAASGYALEGAHLTTGCIDCHIDNRLNVPRECVGCHQTDYNNAVNPNHVLGQFPADCTQCHNNLAWRPASFNHDQTSFPLTGFHLTLACESCHQGGQFAGTPILCFACHENDYNSVQDPNHVTNNFSTDCTQCHSTSAWVPSQFDHSQTQFPLTGAHLALQCILCHASGYNNTPTACFACHENDYNSVQNPNHVSNNFSTDCTQCHSTNAWAPAQFDHSQTQFPLTGAHVGLQCILCHAGGYNNTPTACFACHENDYNSVQDPNHVSNNFSTDCTQCHSTSAWSPAQFDHSQTQFPLTGAHVGLQCILCHAGGYNNTPTACFACHENDYNSVQDPNHVTNNFSTDCTICHNTSAWSPAQFDHSQTQFPLTGAHVGLQCILCHAGGYNNTPTACFACHENDYNSVQDPNHVTNNFSHDCTQCHNTSAWSPAQFDHSQTQFPLTGAHVNLPCISCHANGYNNTPTDCFACHAADYNGAQNPSHQSLGFPTNCEMCHNTSGWPTSWNHDAQYFPIFSGRHQQTWNNCAECHVIPNEWGSFECIFCHDHNQPDMDDAHREVSGYSYNSLACYNCHPRGERP